MILPGLEHPVAYFCAEFAIDNELPTYSGGLGVLAGDLMHEAALQHYPLIGIGILYKGISFLQHITSDGKEEKRDSEFDHDTSFLRPTTIDGQPLSIQLPLENQTVFFKAYHVRLSDQTILFFLSTDVDGNPPEWITDMDALYRGDINSQIRQQILLGVGGTMLLQKLSIDPRIYHINEGRPGLIIWQVTKELMRYKNMDFDKAWKLAKEKIVYTNHTLVDAGNPTYPLEVIERWADPFAKDMQIDTMSIIKDGLDGDEFSITKFALNISSKQSAVSKVHGDYAKAKWPNYNWISITNGVHMPRWQDSDFRKKPTTDAKIWDLHMLKKRELVDTVVKRTGFGYNPERLVVTWARRLAEYKQPRSIFKDIKRLKSILSNDKYPVQLLFAGNSHSADPNSKSIIEEIIKIFSTELAGYAIFVPNYNISLANHMVSGSDVWLNTPNGNLEASGTSGMKAASNGVINCTVLDGWTKEVDWNGIGWVLDPDNIAEDFYNLLEKEIIPLYFNRNDEGLPIAWVERMKRSIELVEDYTSERMFNEYKKLLY